MTTNPGNALLKAAEEHQALGNKAGAHGCNSKGGHAKNGGVAVGGVVIGDEVLSFGDAVVFGDAGVFGDTGDSILIGSGLTPEPFSLSSATLKHFNLHRKITKTIINKSQFILLKLFK